MGVKINLPSVPPFKDFAGLSNYLLAFSKQLQILEQYISNHTHKNVPGDYMSVTIQPSSVTYAMMQNVAANNVVLGNIAGTNQPVTELTTANLVAMIGSSIGWVPISASVTLTYASVNTINTSADLTGSISVGMRLQITQTTVKYFIVVAITSSLITVYGGTDYTVANATITSPYYSFQKAPYGMNISPAKWTVAFTSTADTSYSGTPVSGTGYNLASASIVIPIGLWNLSYQATVQGTTITSVSVYIRAVLGTTANTMTTNIDNDTMSLERGTCTDYFAAKLTANKILSLAAQATYYLNVAFNSSSIAANGLALLGSTGGTIFIQAVCAYL
jgi:hypothetical protein